MRYLLLISFLFFINPLYAQEKLSISLQNGNLRDEIFYIAKFLHINVMLSPTINGTATFELQNAEANHALDLLLFSQGLERMQIGNIWLVASREELLRQKQQEIKWRNAQEETIYLTTKVWQIKYAQAETIVHLLQNDHNVLLSKRGYLRADIRTNKIYIADLPPNVENVYKIVEQLDIPAKQILIEARLVSIDSDCERSLGIQFGQKENEDGPNRGLYSLAVAKLADGTLLDVKLAALEDEGRAELISSPSLFAINQEVASIETGEEIPYQEVSESGGTAVAFKKAVLGLKVMPQILPGQNVLLKLQISQDRPSHRLVLGMPTISTRQLVTQVLARSGQTIVLGGIYETNQEEGQRDIPVLSKLPMVGMLFKQQNMRQNKRELLIFVTPRIIT